MDTLCCAQRQQTPKLPALRHFEMIWKNKLISLSLKIISPNKQQNVSTCQRTSKTISVPSKTQMSKQWAVPSVKKTSMKILLVLDWQFTTFHMLRLSAWALACLALADLSLTVLHGVVSLHLAWLFSGYMANKSWKLTEPIVQGNSLFIVMGEETCEQKGRAHKTTMNNRKTKSDFNILSTWHGCLRVITETLNKWWLTGNGSFQNQSTTKVT